MDTERTFFSADELLWDREISAALAADETFEPWRCDPITGVQWYKLVRQPMIHAVPAESEISGGIEPRGGE